jgi:Zn-finger domain-containing protein
MPLLEDFADLRSRMNQEGFHYCFKHYSNFKEIKDEEFHKLRLSYIDSSKKIKEYITNKLKEEIEYGDDFE